MSSLLNAIPRPVLVVVVLLVGIALFIFNEPLHTVCDTQKDIFIEGQLGKTFAKPVKGGRRSPIIYKMQQACRLGGTGGSCFEYFATLRNFLRDLEQVPSQCLAPITTIPEVKKTLLDGAEIMLRLAWGDKPPESGMSRFNWFETADIALFCHFKKIISEAWGEEAWNQFRLVQMKKLPGAASLSATEFWQRSIFSVRCESF